MRPIVSEVFPSRRVRPGWPVVVGSFVCVAILALEYRPAAAGVVVDWSFDQTNGAIVHDSGPNGIDGVLQGTTAWVSGPTGNALGIGSDGFADFTQPGSPKVPTVISSLAYGSIGLRFRVEEFPQHPVTWPALPLFWMGRDYGGSGQYGLTVEIGHGPPYTPTFNHHLYFTIMDGSTPIQCFNTVEEIVAGVWYSFVGVVGPTGNTGFLNGLEMTNRHYNFGDATTTHFFSSVTSPSDALWVGKGFLGDETGADHFYGLVKDVQIHDEPLSAGDVALLYAVLAVPEIDPAGMGSILALVAGAFGLVERRRLAVA